MLFHHFYLVLLSFLVHLTSVHGIPIRDVGFPGPASLHKRAEELTVRLVCYQVQKYHVALIVDRDEYDVSYRYHATQRGLTRTFELSRDRREDGSYVDSGIPKLVANVPLTSNADDWDKIDDVINDTSLLPSSGYDCWQYIKKALQLMENSGWVSSGGAESSYNDLLAKATAAGMRITCQTF
ncbi:hypothetical protein C8034_v005077 [Colletotrichum sidae]|uniref:Uncharacterized protein n=1 Tax=Colletotrichum sidae TaxID=1347389 RepID=A0A4R8RSG4_9PEZI|nr:hypothetical protein C8034_v005077 [Colletotrichum sidae]